MDGPATMDLTPYLGSLEGNTFDAVLLSVASRGKVAIAMKGRFLLRALCESISDRRLFGCAITEEEGCLDYLKREAYDLLLCSDHLENGKGFDLTRRARALYPDLKVVMLALGDVIPAEYEHAPWLEAVVAEADIVDDQRPLQAAVIAVMHHPYCRSPSLRSGRLPYLSCPRLTPREYEVLDLLASGLSDREIARKLVVSDTTARTYTKRLLRPWRSAIACRPCSRASAEGWCSWAESAPRKQAVGLFRERDGSPEIRTQDQSVKSRMLYR